MNQKSTRRYLVKGYAESPAWSGCTWAYGCSKLDSALSLFSKKEKLLLSKESEADPDLISHGSAKTFWPVISLFLTGIVGVAVYVLRSLWLLGTLAYRKAEKAEWA